MKITNQFFVNKIVSNISLIFIFYFIPLNIEVYIKYNKKI